MIEIINGVKINWSKFKSKTKGLKLEGAKRLYINFCIKIDKVGFGLGSDFTTSNEEVVLIYKIDENIKLNTTPSRFINQTYPNLIKIMETKEDVFIKISKIEEAKNKAQYISVTLKEKLFNTTFDININNYNSFVSSRKEFYEIVAKINFRPKSPYIRNDEKVLLEYIYNKNIKLNMLPNNFKRCTYERLLKIINNNYGDEFIRIVGINNNGENKDVLVLELKENIFGVKFKIDMNNYNSFSKNREEIYKIIKKINFKATSPYLGMKKTINLVSEYDKNIKLNIKPTEFKNTYKCILKIINNNYGDEFIRISEVRIDKGGRQNIIIEIREEKFNNILKMQLSDYGVKFLNGRKDTYDYCEKNNFKPLSPYLGANMKMLIDFNCGHTPHWITPHMLKYGQICPSCQVSKGEKKIIKWFEDNDIKYDVQKKFFGLKLKRELKYDIYIPSLNWLIEYDGKQHFEPVDFAGKGEEWAIKEFKETQRRDKIKNEFAKTISDYFTRIPYWDFDNIETILDNKLKEILDTKEAYNEVLEEYRKQVV